MTITINNSYRPKIVGGLILGQSIIGFLVNEVLIGPYTFSKDFLTVMSAHSFEITVAMVLALIGELMSMTAAVLLIPVFKKQNETVAYAYLVLSGVTFGAVAADNINIQSLLTLSKDYMAAANTQSHYFETMGTVTHAARVWTHLMTILVSCLPFTLFYLLMFSLKLIPRFISIWGFIAIALMAYVTLMLMFDKEASLLLLVPMGLNQLVLVGWLLVKGFPPTATESTSDY
ncbi:MAG: DUF4386 domain-containing protein [Bacteroidetes bacterium]|nr:DUF4386 domain-containing protein [Bacteroidota bacterium]